MVTSTENGTEESVVMPIGNGTVISPDGFILTNAYVVDMAAHRDQLTRWEAAARNAGEELVLDLDEDQLLILGSTEYEEPPAPRYVVEVVEQDVNLGLAVLHITGDAGGTPLDAERPALPYIPLADSDALQAGEPIYIFSYCRAMVSFGPTLYLRDVSGFESEPGVEGVAWITTSDPGSMGCGGGTAFNRQGELIGVPAQGTSLTCEQGDRNGDGAVNTADMRLGCTPIGGQMGQLRPINLARDLILDALPDDMPHGEP
jgi:S1-C subfamily serine protease